MAKFLAIKESYILDLYLGFGSQNPISLEALEI
jgi:hypothetical protein